MQNNQVKLLVRGAYVITDPSTPGGGVLEDAAVAVDRKGTVFAVGPYSDLSERFADVPVEGGPECLVMPGLIDAHSHGMGLTYFELGVGYDHLEYWNTVIPSIGRPDPYLDALWCGIKHIRSGCTTLHHMNDVVTPQDATTPISAYGKLGIRWAYSPTIQDQDFLTYGDETFLESLPQDLQAPAREVFSPDSKRLQEEYFENFRAIYDEHNTPGTPVGLGPMGPQWCSPKLLQKVNEVAHELGVNVHMHAIQTPYQNDAVFRRHGMSGVSYLSSLGVLSPRLTLGHAVWVSEDDIELLAAAGCSVTHHPACNLNMRNGILPLKQLLAAGVDVALGIDGKGFNDDEDMIVEMRVAEKLHRIADLQPGVPLSVTPSHLLAMATTSGAHVLGLQDVCGSLKEGMAADIAVVDLTPKPYVDPAASPQDRLVMQKSKGDVRTVIVNGEVIMRDGAILTVDQASLYSELIESIAPPTDATARRRNDLLRRLRPHIAKHYNYHPIPRSVAPFYVVNRRE